MQILFSYLEAKQDIKSIAAAIDLYLNNDHYFVIGKWKLTRTVGDLNGVYTLLFKKTKAGWKIIADHSS